MSGTSGDLSPLLISVSAAQRASSNDNLDGVRSPLRVSLNEVVTWLDDWLGENENPNFDPVGFLQRLAELVEKDLEKFYKGNPDPFDTRHPIHVAPESHLGQVLKIIPRYDDFISKLFVSYLTSRDNKELVTAALRLILDLAPGLDFAAVVQDNDDFVPQLFRWSQCSDQPLQAYAIGLLGVTMELQNVASLFKEQNSILVPKVLAQLHHLQAEMQLTEPRNPTLLDNKHEVTDFRYVLHSPNINPREGDKNDPATTSTDAQKNLPEEVVKQDSSLSSQSESWNRKRLHSGAAGGESLPKRARQTVASQQDDEFSNSSWAQMAPYVIGRHCMFPLSITMQQRLLLHYLIPVGEYQELLSYAFEHNALQLILDYIDITKNQDVRLTFDAMRYLASLLCHKKFALNFVSSGGVERLLKVYKLSMASAAVAPCLYYLAYYDDVMERVCQRNETFLDDLVGYALWLMEHSYEHARYNTVLFFAHGFSHRVILELFDAHDGLRKLVNLISTLDILQQDVDDERALTDDETLAVRHVPVALAKYFEVHLFVKVEQLKRNSPRFLQHVHGNDDLHVPSVSPARAVKLSQQELEEYVSLMHECLVVHAAWKPVELFRRLGGDTLLMQIVALSSHWTFGALPAVQLQLCNPITLPGDAVQKAAPLGMLLALCDGEIVDAAVQKAALRVIVSCVCGSMSKGTKSMSDYPGDPAKTRHSSSSQVTLLQKMWECVQNNNGIMVLRNLLFVKSPITEADSIRTLACQALDGLARSDVVRQIISKMPLIVANQLHLLMQEPIMQDRRAEHVKFCQYARSLSGRVTGRQVGLSGSVDIDRLYKVRFCILFGSACLQYIVEHWLAYGVDVEGRSDAMQRLERRFFNY